MLELIQKKIIIFLKLILKKYIRNILIKNLDIQINTNREYLFPLLLFLNKHYNIKCKQLLDIIVVDKINKLNRFSIHYNLLSLSYNTRIRIKIQTSELLKVNSICQLFSSAN